MDSTPFSWKIRRRNSVFARHLPSQRDSTAAHYHVTATDWELLKLAVNHSADSVFADLTWLVEHVTDVEAVTAGFHTAGDWRHDGHMRRLWSYDGTNPVLFTVASIIYISDGFGLVMLLSFIMHSILSVARRLKPWVAMSHTLRKLPWNFLKLNDKYHVLHAKRRRPAGRLSFES